MLDVRRFLKGDHQYFEELLRTHGPLVLFVARAYATDPDHAEDLFQEIWKRAFEKRDSYQARGSFEGWLHRLATNVCIGDYRTRRAHARNVEQMGKEGEAESMSWLPPDPLKEAERREFHQRLHRAMAHLSEREHEAVWLRVLEGKTPAEVAKIMGVEKATVRSHIRHAINRLKKIMEDPGHDLPRYQSSH